MGAYGRLVTGADMRGVIALILWGLASPAWATTYHAGSDCKPLETYAASPDVEARPGYDAKGRAVASPDLQPSSMDIEALKQPSIALDMPMGAHVKQDSYNADLSRADIEVGRIKLGPQGEVRLNDQILSTGQQSVYPKGCE
jgi:hypothetical protein